MFCISFVVVTVKARLASLDPRLEQAAMDLYADEWQTFRRITLPLVAPGIVAGALLAFALSFDDFIITNFNSGAVNTFPKFVWVSIAARHPGPGERHRFGDVLPGPDRRAVRPVRRPASTGLTAMTASLAAPAVAALADVQFAPFWTDAAPGPDPCPPLAGSVTADLAVVGSGLHRALGRAARQGGRALP